MIRKILVGFLILASINVSAQRTNSSPYSFFGIGEGFKSMTVEQVSMGGIGAAYSSQHSFNFTNPAANASLRYATYAFGLLNNDLTIDDGTEKQSSTSTSLSYFAFGTPLGKRAGFTVGMQPVSSVGYSLSNQIEDVNGDATEVTLFSGTGGVNRIYGSFGISINKNLSLGIEGDFAFGNIENSISNQRADVFLATKYTKKSNIRGGSVKVGAQYKKELKKDLVVELGAVLKLSSTYSANGTEDMYSLSYSFSGAEIPRDTLLSGTISGEFKIPLKTIIGAGLGKPNQWYAGVEYEFQEAISASGYLNDIGAAFAYDSSNRISLGGFYLPKASSISSYWDRVTYRAGLRFEKTGLLVNGTSIVGNFTAIDDFGMSFGLGLPMGNRLSNVNLGFEFGKKGATANKLIQENYFNFRLSLSLNAVLGNAWFRKRQID